MWLSIQGYTVLDLHQSTVCTAASRYVLPCASLQDARCSEAQPKCIPYKQNQSKNQKGFILVNTSSPPQPRGEEQNSEPTAGLIRQHRSYAAVTVACFASFSSKQVHCYRFSATLLVGADNGMEMPAFRCVRWYVLAASC